MRHLSHERRLAARVWPGEQHERRIAGAQVHIVGHERARARERDARDVPQRLGLEERCVSAAVRMRECEGGAAHGAGLAAGEGGARQGDEHVELRCCVRDLRSTDAIGALRGAVHLDGVPEQHG